MSQFKSPVTVAMTGASGAAYGMRLIECLLAENHQVYLLYSQAAQVVINMELDMNLPSRAAEAEEMLRHSFSAEDGQLQVFGRQQWIAPVASGTNPPEAMVVCPCTTGTLATIAQGVSNDLIGRAADVALKERKKLLLVVRETPLSAIHLENMLRVTNAGGVIMPANPGFYTNPEKIEDLVDFMVARVLDHLGVDHQLIPRWGEE
ncbi:MAG: flavin prenyltransferase UbiX [bacterium]